MDKNIIISINAVRQQFGKFVALNNINMDIKKGEIIGFLGPSGSGKSGTLDRILATPLRRGEIVWGYFLGFGVFVAIQTVVIQIFIMYGLNVTMAGSFWLVLIINLILAGQSLALGTLLSSFAQNEFQLFQFIPLVIVPQILFSGIFDLSEAPQWVSMLSKIFPLTYGADALRGVMIKGFGFFEVQKDIYILISYAVVFLFLNTLALKKYRKT